MTDIRKSETSKDRTAGEIVRISLAVAMLMPWAEVAYGQLAVDCTRPIEFDTIAVCGLGGTLQVQPDGDVVTDGCIVPMGSVRQALCSVKSFATSGSLQIMVTATKLKISNGVKKMQVNNFNVATDAAGPTKAYTSLTLTATPINFGIGADLIGGGSETTGAYNGSLMLRVIFTP